MDEQGADPPFIDGSVSMNRSSIDLDRDWACLGVMRRTFKTGPERPGQRGNLPIAMGEDPADVPNRFLFQTKPRSCPTFDKEASGHHQQTAAQQETESTPSAATNDYSLSLPPFRSVPSTASPSQHIDIQIFRVATESLVYNYKSSPVLLSCHQQQRQTQSSVTFRNTSTKEEKNTTSRGLHNAATPTLLASSHLPSKPPSVQGKRPTNEGRRRSSG